MHSQCGSVFNNAFLQYSHVATADVLRDVCGQADAMLRVVGRVLDVLRGREHNNAGRPQVSVMSSSDARKCHLKVL